MRALQPVRGTRDIMGDEARGHRHVVETARAVAGLYGFGDIATPVFEFTDVFKRTLGDTTDIVTKEMYTFDDRGGDSLTLRPEGTAGVARAIISGGLFQSLPLKLFYAGPMFRYERPQKGRYRQFHQIGAELVGVPGPEADIEVIALAAHILDALDIAGTTVLKLNTLGDAESRSRYRAALVEHFTAHRDTLSEDSRDRLGRNPLRILDSKAAEDQPAIAAAPPFGDHLGEAPRAFFARVQEGLSDLGIAFELEPRLVRGLDYYCHTAFEFVTEALGSQGTVIGGGRYDGLIGMMGGPETPAVGWAGGIERLAMLLATPPQPPRPVAIVPLGEVAEREARRLAGALRRAGVAVDMGYSGNLKRRMARAAKAEARWAVILGDTELARGVATLRDMDGGAQDEVPLDRVAAVLASRAVPAP